MSGWITERADAYCDSVRDGTHDSPKPVERGHRLITSKHIANETLNFAGANFISDEDYEAINQRSKVDVGDLLFSMIGTVGRVYHVDDEPDYAIKNMGLFKISDELKSKYLFYYMQSPTAKQYIEGCLAGSTQKFMSLTNLRAFPIVYPNDHTTMAAIVEILDSLTWKHRINQRTNDYLIQLGMEYWKLAAGRSPSMKKIADIAADIITGKTPPTKKAEYYGRDYPFVTIPDMHSATWLCSTERCLSKLGNAVQPKKLVPRGAVLVSCIATIGLVGIVQRPSHFNQQINAVIPGHAGDEYYLYYALNSIKDTLLGIGATGSATLNVNKRAFSNIEIPWPDRLTMERYTSNVSPLFKLIENNSIESLRLRGLRDALLPKLISGDIDATRVII